MTTPEHDAMQRAADILGEHFTAHLIIALEDVLDGDGESIRMDVRGGIHLCIGLAKRAEHALLTGDYPGGAHDQSEDDPE